jgi:hypothetical protein
MNHQENEKRDDAKRQYAKQARANKESKEKLMF